jgi:murein DD-endopeptidase MepM/ murein hydrolase activator NlpD
MASTGLALCAGLAVAAPARAQEAPLPDPPPETTETTAPPTDPGLPVDTTLPPVTVPGEETTTTTAPPEDPAAGGDAPSETVPEDDFVIPPRPLTPLAVAGPAAGPGGQAPFAGYPGRLVRVTARTARSRASETQLALDAAVANRDALLAQQAQQRAELGRLAVEERAAVTALEAAQVALEHRAADAYIRGSLAPVGMLLNSEDVTDYYHQRELLQAVLDADEDALREFQAARRAVDDGQARVAADLARLEGEVGAAEQAVAAAQLDHELASRELAVFLAGGNVVIHGFAFPVAGPTNFIDSFGFPRMTGTEYEHWHEGTDVFADAGTPLVACERGVVTRMGSNVLGGITLWLRGESGVSYYYAHLSAFAAGVAPGQVVEAGTVLGYVGNTGNAATTPSHLHFEVHPNGAEAINPYPLLAVAKDQPQPTPVYLG